ncbi:Protein FAM83G [Merluccius polli]|uniref:Protein FAM83G n=1 Tax=Merluccius polli TaxID=89951 RepID=A0AA47NYQ8_MERPO|nr:Protein FAM83G [Merluccius polli]
MALSQVQCLDNHHVNSRVSESKPEFFYSEDQRLALEALISAGRDGFLRYVREKGVREFLSEPELEWLARTAEAYRPGHEHPLLKTDTTAAGPGNLTPASVDDEVSLQYWPDRSEASVAELDLGWPESISYRGITRVAVHTQPPVEGHTHIKEVVRKTIAAASKVIAVVMDAFTDVDIFRDLLDAGYKRKIPVYIIIDQAAVPCFLAMCGRADMHRGHLKNLRVRSCGGVEFYTRVAQKVRGSLNQRFLLVDGDRAISGSYSFTWSSSRLDRNLITVITGQVVETFDQQFRDLYLTSRGVSLSKVSMADEPIPDTILYSAPAPIPASVARKLINPKYALVTSGNHASPTSSGQNSSNRNSASQNPLGLIMLKRIREPLEEPPLHPGLAHLEKAYLIPYLPTWPEPDPPSDVIGFINIRDEKRAHQVHLQRSELFQTSQAIRFSSPFTPTPQPDKQTPAKAQTDARPSESRDRDVPPAPPTDLSAQPVVEPTHTAPKPQPTDETDSSAPPERADAPGEKHAPRDRSPPKKSEIKDTRGSPATKTSKPTPEAPTAAAPPPAAPPIPKPRTLQLVIEPGSPTTHSGQPQISLVRKIHIPDMDVREAAEDAKPGPRARAVSHREDKDSGDGSQDSTKVICDDDAATPDNTSSVSTASEEEFYECNTPEPADPLTNGATTGSGHGGHHGDGLNVMARFSQSMLDLRAPSQPEDSRSLIHQSQQLRRQIHQSPHRHIGQLFNASRSPGGEGPSRGPKVIVAKPGSFHRPEHAVAPVIGGHRYWQGQALRMDVGRARAGRSPRRHSPSYRKEGNASAPQQPSSNPAVFLGASFSKLGNLRQLRTRAAGSPKKASQSRKDTG